VEERTVDRTELYIADEAFISAVPRASRRSCRWTSDRWAPAAAAVGTATGPRPITKIFPKNTRGTAGNDGGKHRMEDGDIAFDFKEGNDSTINRKK